jgi:hypothetical protein
MNTSQQGPIHLFSLTSRKRSTLNEMTENHMRNKYFPIGLYSPVFGNFSEEGYTLWHDDWSHEKWILSSSSAFNYFCWLRWRGLHLMKSPKITWGINTFHKAPIQLLLLSSQKRSTLDEITPDHVRNEYFSRRAYPISFAHLAGESYT